MKKSFKKLVLAGVIASVMSVSLHVPQAHAAGIFTFNPSALAEMINQGVQSAKQWAVEKATMIAHMQQDVLLQAQEIMNDNNIAANREARGAQVLTDIANIKLAQDTASHKAACDSVAFSIEVGTSECEVEDNFKQGMEESTVNTIDLKTAMQAAKMAGGTDGKDPGNPIEPILEGAKDILQIDLRNQVEFCKQPLEDENYEAPEYGHDRGAYLKSPCTMLYALAGGEGTHLSPKVDRAVRESIKVLVTTPTSNNDVPNALNTRPDQDIKDYRRYAYQGLVLNSFHRLRVLHAASDSASGTNKKISFLGALESTITAKFGSIEGALGIMKATNTDDEKNTTPGISAKSLDEIARFNLYLNYLKYQQQIRMEALMAATLSLELQRSDL